VNKKELIGAVAEHTELSRAKAAEVVDAVFGAIEGALKKKEEVRLIGIGTFATAHRAATTGRNPRTREEMTIPASATVRFKFGKRGDFVRKGDLPADNIPSANLLADRHPDVAAAVTRTRKLPARPATSSSEVRTTSTTDAAANPPSGPIKAALHVLDRWHIADPLGAIILGSPEPDFVAGLRAGIRDLATRDMQDRARLLLDIYEGVFTLLRDPKAERDWIRIPREDFAGRTLLDLMTEGSQRNLIQVQAFVDYSNGR
jgi:DNA-binding protein HU-beta